MPPSAFPSSHPSPMNPWAALSVSSITSGFLGYLGLYGLAGWEGTSHSANIAYGATMPLVGTSTGLLTEKTATMAFQRFNQGGELTDNQIRGKELLKRLTQMGTPALTALACESLGFEGTCPAHSPFTMLGQALWYAPAAVPAAGAVVLAAGTFDEKAPSLECAVAKPLALLSSLFLTLPAISNVMHHMWDASYSPGMEMIKWQATSIAYGVGSALLIASLVQGALAQANIAIAQKDHKNIQATPISDEDQTLAYIKMLAANEPETFAKIIAEAQDPVVKAELQAVAHYVALEKLSHAVHALLNESTPPARADELTKEIKAIAAANPELFAAVLAEAKDPVIAACLQKIAAELAQEKSGAALAAPAA